MADPLLEYYEKELTYLRHAAVEFAEKYPGEAASLQLEAGRGTDPFVERLLEGVAFLAARVHRRLDDDFPEIVEGLLNVIYPHFLRPVPSSAIVQFELDSAQGLSQSVAVKRGQFLYTRPAGDQQVQCKFQVCYDTEVWPVRVVSTQWMPAHDLMGIPGARDAIAALRLGIEAFPGASLSGLNIPRLRLYLNGEPRIAHALYELLSNNCEVAVIRDAPRENQRKSGVRPAILPLRPITTAGWSEEESLLPWPQRSFTGYRLLHEYFAFPEKFLFLDLGGLEGNWDARLECRAEIVFLISRFERPERHEMLESAVRAGAIQLGCTPVTNLFQKTAEPISIDQTRHQYPIIPDLHRRGTLEVFSIDEVTGTNRQTRATRTYQPIFSWRHGAGAADDKAFWFSTRRPSTRKDDEGADVSLSFVDLNGAAAVPAFETITVECTCTNRDLPARLLFGQNPAGDFDLDGTAAIQRILTLRKPGAPLRPPVRSGLLWRLISHLSLNYMSLLSDGRDALQEMLRLYNYSGSLFINKQIEGITSIRSSPKFGRVASDHGVVFARGTYVDMELDEEQFTGSGAWLFASVIERFLGQHVSLNSFTQLAVRSPQRKELLNTWPPRAGNRILV